MRRVLVLLVILFWPALLIAQTAQTTQVTYTSAGDTVLTYASAKAQPPIVANQPPLVTVDSVVVKRAKVKPDTVFLPASTPAPTPAPALTSPLGKPLGPVNALTAAATSPPYTLSFDVYGASDIVSRIDAARRQGVRLVLALTGGAHSNYMTNGVFDRAKWNAKMQTFNTATIRDAIAKGVADGTILGASVMDEPQVSSTTGGNTWGPVGTMTKARVDSMCGYMKAIFPTLPAGVAHRYDMFEPTKSYWVCEFILSSYMSWAGNATTFRDGAMAMAQRDNLAFLFSLNVLDGGPRVSGCPVPQTGGPGTYGTNCRMTAAQVTDYGKLFLAASATCGLLMWQYDSQFFTRTDNLAAVKDLGAFAAQQPARSCAKP